MVPETIAMERAQALPDRLAQLARLYAEIQTVLDQQEELTRQGHALSIELSALYADIRSLYAEYWQVQQAGAYLARGPAAH